MDGKLVRFAEYASGRSSSRSHSHTEPPPSRGVPGGASRRGPPVSESRRLESSARARSHTHPSRYDDHVHESRHGSSRHREGSLLIPPTSQNGPRYRPGCVSEDPIITRDGRDMRVLGERSSRDQYASRSSIHNSRALTPRERNIHGGDDGLDARMSRLGFDDQPSRASGRSRAMTHHPIGSMNPHTRHAADFLHFNRGESRPTERSTRHPRDLPHSPYGGDIEVGVRTRQPAAVNITVNVNYNIVQL